MKDKWTQGELIPAKSWTENYSRKPQKATSFGFCAFILFSLVFVGTTGIALVFSIFMFILTGINLLISTEINKKKLPSLITLLGYFASISQIIYSYI